MFDCQVKDLEGTVSKLKHEKARLLSQHRYILIASSYLSEDFVRLVWLISV